MPGTQKWQNVYKHFEAFCEGKCSFGEIDVDLCNKFKEYLYTAPQTIHKKQKLHTNTIAGYWSTFRAVLHTAYRDHKIKEIPMASLTGLTPSQRRRNTSHSRNS
jgi:hypothetical protein